MRWSCPVYFDQFEEPSCTGFTTIHAAITEPFPVRRLTLTHSRFLYQRAKELDQWPVKIMTGLALWALLPPLGIGYFLKYGWCFSEKKSMPLFVTMDRWSLEQMDRRHDGAGC